MQKRKKIPCNKIYISEPYFLCLKKLKNENEVDNCVKNGNLNNQLLKINARLIVVLVRRKVFKYVF